MKYTLFLFVILASAFPCANVLNAQDTALVLPVTTVESISSSTLLSPDNAVWNSIQAMPIHLNRTPPLYAGDPVDDGQRPTATVQFARVDDDFFVRITWTDETTDIAGNGARYPDAGEEHVYPRQTQNTSGFADSFCLMVPQKRGPHSAYPSMMMGDKQESVDLYFWRAGEGFSLLGAHGRETVEKVANAPVEGGELRQDGGWSVVIKVPDMTARTPVCFAIWDGGRDQRDGLKYFSIWYEVE